MIFWQIGALACFFFVAVAMVVTAILLYNKHTAGDTAAEQQVREVPAAETDEAEEESEAQPAPARREAARERPAVASWLADAISKYVWLIFSVILSGAAFAGGVFGLWHFYPDLSPSWAIWAVPAGVIAVAWLGWAMTTDWWKKSPLPWLVGMTVFAAGCYGLYQLNYAEVDASKLPKLSEWRTYIPYLWPVIAMILIFWIINGMRGKNANKTLSKVGFAIFTFCLAALMIWGLVLAWNWISVQKWTSDPVPARRSSEIPDDEAKVDLKPGDPKEFTIMPERAGYPGGQRTRFIVPEAKEDDEIGHASEKVWIEFPSPASEQLIELIVMRPNGNSQVIGLSTKSPIHIGRYTQVAVRNKSLVPITVRFSQR